MNLNKFFANQQNFGFVQIKSIWKQLNNCDLEVEICFLEK